MIPAATRLGNAVQAPVSLLSRFSPISGTMYDDFRLMTREPVIGVWAMSRKRAPDREWPDQPWDRGAKIAARDAQFGRMPADLP
jgi:hypothetical protein